MHPKLIKEGRAYDIATMSGMYKCHLTDSGMEKVVVKRRLIVHFGQKMQFHQQHGRNKSELISSPSLNLAEIINLVPELTCSNKRLLKWPGSGRHLCLAAVLCSHYPSK